MKPTEAQREMVQQVAERMAEHAHSPNLDPETVIKQLRWTASLIEAESERAKASDSEAA